MSDMGFPGGSLMPSAGEPSSEPSSEPQLSRKVIALIDGEHYPPVVADALKRLASEYRLLAAVFIGGAEKIKKLPDEETLGYPVVIGESPMVAMLSAILKYSPEAVYDLSDEPVVTQVDRMRFASLALACKVSYLGPDFQFKAPYLPRIATKPTVRVIGTGKRIGKTAVSAYLARQLKAGGRNPLVVAMGRGGPADPQVLMGDKMEISAQFLLDIADSGMHAASDYIEDALLSRVTTIGCRRCGGGLAGEPYDSNVPDGVRLANDLDGDLIVLEGSGSSLPPVFSDSSLLTVSASQDPSYIDTHLGPYRVLTSDAVVITGCDDPDLAPGTIEALEDAIRTVDPELPITRTVFRPLPMEPLQGEKVFLATTAPRRLLDQISRSLEERHGCTVVHASSSLSVRPALVAELMAAEGSYSCVVTELKAAAVDVVTRTALEQGKRVVYFDNEPVAVNGPSMPEVAESLASAAETRFAERARQ